MPPALSNTAASIAIWSALAAVSFPLASFARPSSEVYSFFLSDSVTECFFELRSRFPRAFVDQSMTILMADGTRIRAAFHHALHGVPLRDGDSGTLFDSCGHCSAMAFSNGTTARVDARWMTQLVLRPMEDEEEAEDTDDEEQVLVLLRMPPGDASRFSEAMAAYARAHGVAFVTQTQMEKDVAYSATLEPWRSGLSFALVCVCLFSALARSRARHPLRLTVATLLAMAGVIGVGTALCQLAGVVPSAFSVIVGPLILGVGVDGMMIVLTACNFQERRPSVRQALHTCAPSLIASAATTSLGFLVGACVPIPSIRALCLQALAYVLVCLAAQLTLFPALVEACGLRRSPRVARPHANAFFAVACACLALIPLAADLPHPAVEFDVNKQLRTDTLTAQALARVLDTFGGAPTTTYGLVRSDADWDAIERSLAELPKAEVYSWHPAYAASGAPDVRTWLAQSAGTRALFGDVVDADTGDGVVIARTNFGRDATARDKYDHALRLHALREAGACVFNSDLLAGYTMVRLSHLTAKLVACTCVICVLAGVAIVGAKAVGIAVVLAASYLTLDAAVRLLAVPVDMILLVSFLSTTGIITDYSLHAAHHRDNAHAVGMGALTSALSLLPFATFPVVSVRHFMFVYMLTIAFGCVYSVAGMEALHRMMVAR
jgi:hypothetical protein